MVLIDPKRRNFDNISFSLPKGQQYWCWIYGHVSKPDSTVFDLQGQMQEYLALKQIGNVLLVEGDSWWFHLWPRWIVDQVILRLTRNSMLAWERNYWSCKSWPHIEWNTKICELGGSCFKRLSLLVLRNKNTPLLDDCKHDSNEGGI